MNKLHHLQRQGCTASPVGMAGGGGAVGAGVIGRGVRVDYQENPEVANTWLRYQKRGHTALSRVRSFQDFLQVY